MLPEPTRNRSGRFRFYSVIAVNTLAAAHLDLVLRWSDEIGV
jgi:hypothetical protein